MKRSTFIQSMIGFYGIANISATYSKNYSKIYLLQSFIRGFQYYDGPKLMKNFKEHANLQLVREPKNQYDTSAIALYYQDKKIGFIPSEDNVLLSILLDAKLLEIKAEITHIKTKAQTWENVHIAVYVLKETNPKEKQQLGTYCEIKEPC